MFTTPPPDFALPGVFPLTWTPRREEAQGRDPLPPAASQDIAFVPNATYTVDPLGLWTAILQGPGLPQPLRAPR